MANTNLLKTVVESEIIKTFCNKHQLQMINLLKKEINQIFDDMEPDLIGYHAMDNTLYIGEITTSGYMGQHGHDFHVGAVRKVFEAFSKFYLIHDDAHNVIIRVSKHLPEVKFDTIKCFFIVPEGSKFINALGYRKKLFEKGYMELDTIKLTDKTHEVMIKILTDSKYENKV